MGLASGINPYNYVGGNPVSYLDPAGRDPVGGAVVLGAEIGRRYSLGRDYIGAGLDLTGGYIIADQLSHLIFKTRLMWDTRTAGFRVRDAVANIVLMARRNMTLTSPTKAMRLTMYTSGPTVYEKNRDAPCRPCVRRAAK